MMDFACTSASEMHYTELAERVRYLKEDKSGEHVMVSRVVEQYGDEREARGLAEGMEKGADRLGSLITMLLKQNRLDDVKKVSVDSAYRDKLFKELGIE